MKSALAIVIFAITGLSLYAQKSTIIKCNVTSDIPVKLVIQEPFDIFFGYLSYIDTCQTKSPSNSFTFSRSFDIKQATYYRLMLLDSLNTFVSLTELIAIPQEQINIYLTIKDAMINTKFEGPSSEGHSLFNFTRQDRISFYKPLNSYISTIKPTSNIAADVDSLAKQYIQPYDSLFAKNTISNEYLISISANFRLTSSNFLVYELYSVSNGNVAKLNTHERVVMQNTLFQAIPANNPAQFSLDNGTNYLAAYALYMQNQIEDSNNIDTTINVNNRSLLIKYRFKPFLKLNNQFWQEHIWAAYLSSFIAIYPDMPSDQIDVFEALFPKSRFTKILHEQFLKKHTDIPIQKSPYKIIVLDSTCSYTSLNDILKSKLRRKNIFIDIWATWCAPCKDEFRHNNQVDSILKSKNIERLYISIDAFCNKKRWLEYIQKYNLGGYHIIAGKELYNDIQQKIPFYSIPHFAIINTKGQIVDKNAIRPSNRNKFLKNVKEKIGN